jgi:hypothetical protein
LILSMIHDTWADTTTAHGRLMLTVLGGLAEFERELIRARTGDGRKRAKERGVHMGRPAKLTRHQKSDALKALADGTASQADRSCPPFQCQSEHHIEACVMNAVHLRRVEGLAGSSQLPFHLLLLPALAFLNSAFASAISPCAFKKRARSA